MPTTRTKGSDWLKNNGGRCWCKLLRKSDDISLHQFGGYAMQGLLTGFDRPVMMEPNSFLFVASDYQVLSGRQAVATAEEAKLPLAIFGKSNQVTGAKAPPGMDYRFALIHMTTYMREVPDDEIYNAVYQLMQNKISIIPPSRHHAAFDNPQYTAAIYCKSIFEQTDSASALVASLPPAVVEVAPPLSPVTRRISRGILGTPRTQVPAPVKAQVPPPQLIYSRFGRRPRKPPPES
jgi:hypothetical protein